nr:MBL fold metallo-hydrolase [candidate division Zixibacteria bacterium]
MKITLIYDNETSRDDLIADWGFACLVEFDNHRILFDTGADGRILLKNMAALKIEPESIEIVFISHLHWDHTGGLQSFIRLNPDVRLYIPANYDPPADARKVVGIKDPVQIEKNLFSTGLLEEIEQSLIIKTAHGIVTVVGCSHSGVENILKSAGKHGKNFALIGGLHGFENYEALRDLVHVCPTHCTQHKTEIKEAYPKKYIDGGAGKIIEL